MATFGFVNLANADTYTLPPKNIGQCNTTDTIYNAGGCYSNKDCGFYYDTGNTIKPDLWSRYDVEEIIEWTFEPNPLFDPRSWECDTTSLCIITTSYSFIRLSNIYSTADKYNGPPYGNDASKLNFGYCDGSVGNPYKVCCNGSQPVPAYQVNLDPYSPPEGGCGNNQVYSNDPATGLPAAGPGLTCPQPTTCPAGQTGTPPNCVTPPPPTTPRPTTGWCSPCLGGLQTCVTFSGLVPQFTTTSCGAPPPPPLPPPPASPASPSSGPAIFKDYRCPTSCQGGGTYWPAGTCIERDEIELPNGSVRFVCSQTSGIEGCYDQSNNYCGPVTITSRACGTSQSQACNSTWFQPLGGNKCGNERWGCYSSSYIPGFGYAAILQNCSASNFPDYCHSSPGDDDTCGPWTGPSCGTQTRTCKTTNCSPCQATRYEACNAPGVTGPGGAGGGGGGPATTPPAPPPPPPPICSGGLSANPQNVFNPGDKSTLSWSCSSPSSCLIDKKEGTGSFTFVSDVSNSGTKEVFPTTGTTYRLTCTNAGGPSSYQATIQVIKIQFQEVNPTSLFKSMFNFFGLAVAF